MRLDAIQALMFWSINHIDQIERVIQHRSQSHLKALQDGIAPRLQRLYDAPDFNRMDGDDSAVELTVHVDDQRYPLEISQNQLRQPRLADLDALENHNGFVLIHGHPWSSDSWQNLRVLPGDQIHVPGQLAVTSVISDEPAPPEWQRLSGSFSDVHLGLLPGFQNVGGVVVSVFEPTS
jgi:hypothetical protein